ncbi:MAG: YceI family protein [Bdellovibrionales bacterium]|nr:YceI family protein [Bdellovibrionales bacterium]
MFRILTSIMTVALCSVAFSAEKNAAPKESNLTRVNIDTTKSVIKWKGTKAFVGDSHVGTVNFSSGTLFVDKDKITGGDLTIDMKSIKNTDVTDPNMNGKLVGHLNSEDFFAVDANKEAKFVIKEVKSTGKDTYDFIGDATIRGVTQPMKIKATVKRDGAVWLATGKTDFDRTKFGVKYNSKDFFPDLIKSGKDKVIKNDIELEFNLKTI